ncbi:MAG: DUF2884 family protein [Enterobacteriaceae bacterium]
MKYKLSLAAVLLSTSVIAQAGYDCPVKPGDDIIITPKTVQIVGNSGDITITPEGDVVRKGKTETVSAHARQLAKQYQAALRQDLPEIEQQAQKQLNSASMALDKVVQAQLGKESKVRSHLQDLSTEMRRALAKVLEKREPDTLIFHHMGIMQAEKEGREKVEQTLGAVLQDSLNELGNKALGNKSSDNPLQAMLGGVGELQGNITNEWKRQEQGFQHLGESVCGKITRLEQQRKALLQALPE